MHASDTEVRARARLGVCMCVTVWGQHARVPAYKHVCVGGGGGACVCLRACVHLRSYVCRQRLSESEREDLLTVILIVLLSIYLYIYNRHI